MRAILIKSTVVLALGGVALASPQRADAAGDCDTLLGPTACQTYGEDYLRGYCDAKCPAWVTATCFPSGYVVCWDLET
jgi:hypothetical protein